ncbi:MAG: putative Ig domain-containing protein [Acidobacteria bacterium]|nr:putative Ig domain-containing protein [Acidobacteriota bacterium]
MRTTAAKGILLLLVTTAMIASAMAAGPRNGDPARFHDARILAKFRDGVTPAQQSAILQGLGARGSKTIGPGIHVLEVGKGRVLSVVQALKASPDVLYAEPDYIHSIDAGVLPNDPSEPLRWDTQNTGQAVDFTTGTPGADQRTLGAWSVTTGGNSVVVAVLDTGVQYSHPDLLTNMWVNPGGVGGCPAGTFGFNVINNTCDPMDDEVSPYGYTGHGTHMAGIIGAIGNNGIGVAGVNWTTSIMAVKWIHPNDDGFTSDLIAAMDFVLKAKAAGVNVRVVNDSASYPGTAYSQALADQIDLLGANDILFVTSAGNTQENNDTTPRYPCSYNRPTEICVAASDQDDRLWDYSNSGVNSVDLAAPGVNIFSPNRFSGWDLISGSSDSAAQVSGAAALILSAQNLSVAALKSKILSNVDQLPALTSVVATGGRLNVCKAVPGCNDGVTATPANTSRPVVAGTPRFGSILNASTGVWTGVPTRYTYQWLRCGSAGGNCTDIPGATSATYAMLAAADTNATFRVNVTAWNAAGSSTAQSNASAVAASAASPFAITSTITGGTLSGNRVWQATPGQPVAFVQFYIDGAPAQMISSSPYQFNQSSSGMLDTTTLANGTYVLGIRALSSDARTYGFQSATVTIANAPQNTGLPAVTGSPVQGQTLTTSNGTWTNSPTSFAYSWLRCDGAGANCTTITGATASTYILVAADVGSTIRSSVRATNSNGSNTANSSATATVTASSTPSIVTSPLPVGTQSVAYSATLQAAGGTGTYTWSIVSGTLPSGLGLAASTGTISGTPSAIGTSNFTVRVTDSSSQFATKALSISVVAAGGGGAAAIRLIQSASGENLGQISQSVPFASSNTAGNLIIAFVRYGTLTNTVSITDSAGNVYTEAAMVQQLSEGDQARLFYAKNIAGGPNTVTATFSDLSGFTWLAVHEYSGLSRTNPLDQTATGFNSTIQAATSATGQTQSPNELLFAGIATRPEPGLVLTPGGGFSVMQVSSPSNGGATESRVVTSTGSYQGSFTLNFSTEWAMILATFAPDIPLSIPTSSLPGAVQNSGYAATVSAAGGAPPYTWSVTVGTLPAGLTLAANSGIISGTPTALGTSNFTVQVRDSAAQTTTRALTLTVTAPSLSITTATLPIAVQNRAFSTALGASAGTQPYSWSIASGSPPPGLTLTAGTGEISGTPTTTGTFSFTARVTDSASATATKALSLTVNPPLSVATNALPGATVSTFYHVFLSASGGNSSSYTWAITSGTLPVGFTLAPTIGAISGTPSTLGTSNFTVQVTDGNGQTASRALQITVFAAGFVVSTTSMPSGTVGTAYSGNLFATGGGEPYSWSINSGTLPAGLTLIASTGAISGTPTTAGTFNFTAMATDSNLNTATRALSILINSPSATLTITTASLPNGTQGTAYSAQLTASGGTMPYSWSLATGTLPAGLTLTASTGAISGTPSTAGTSSFTVRVTDASAQTTTRALSITIDAAGATLTVTTASLPAGTQNTAYSAQLSATGGLAPYSWNIATGILPPGVGLTASTGAISGTPTVTGTFSFTARVTDANAQTATRALSITINAAGAALTVTNTSLPAGTQGTVYNAQLTASGGTAPYSWNIATGILPPGLGLTASTGTISGTPTVVGTFSFTARVTDADAQTATRALSITISAPGAALAITNTSLPAGTQNTAYSAQLSATGGTAPYSWSIATGALPAGLTLIASTGAISGTPTATGTSSFTIRVTDVNAQTATRALSITISASSATLAVTTTFLPAGTQNTAYNAQLTASGGTAPYTWSIATGTLPAGLTLTESTGAISGTPTATGTSNFTVEVSDSAANAATRALSITIGSVAPPPPPPSGGGGGGFGGAAITPASIVPSPTSLNFTARVRGPIPQTQTLTIGNGGSQFFNWQASLDPANVSDWLSLSQTSGTAGANIAVSVTTTNLAPGTYEGMLLITAPGAMNSPTSVKTTYEVTAPPALIFGPATLNFASKPGSNPASQQLTVTSSAEPISWTAAASTTSGGNWLSLSPASARTPGSITVNVNAAGLAAGGYTGTIRFSNADDPTTTQTVQVNLSVGTPVIALKPESMVFATGVGKNPPTQTLQVQNAGDGALGWNATVATQSGGSWLKITPTTAVADSTITVTADATGLAAGVYNGTITIGGLPGSNITNSPQVVPVTLAIDTPVIFSGGIVDGAAFSKDGVSAGAITSMFGVNLAGTTTTATLQPVASPARKLADNPLALPTTLAGTQVLVNGAPAPLFYVSPTQVNFQMPIGAAGAGASVVVVNNGRRSPAVQVNVDPLDPRIFTVGGGTQGAVLNEDFSLNSAQSPIAAGSVIQIFANGLGATDPALITGQVAGSSPLQMTTTTPVVLIGGVPAEVLFSGLAPGFVGLYQVNALVPQDIATGGAVPLQIQMGGNASNTLTIAVR